MMSTRSSGIRVVASAGRTIPSIPNDAHASGPASIAMANRTAPDNAASAAACAAHCHDAVIVFPRSANPFATWNASIERCSLLLVQVSLSRKRAFAERVDSLDARRRAGSSYCPGACSGPTFDPRIIRDLRRAPLVAKNPQRRGQSRRQPDDRQMLVERRKTSSRSGAEPESDNGDRSTSTTRRASDRCRVFGQLDQVR